MEVPDSLYWELVYAPWVEVEIHIGGTAGAGPTVAATPQSSAEVGATDNLRSRAPLRTAAPSHSAAPDRHRSAVGDSAAPSSVTAAAAAACVTHTAAKRRRGASLSSDDGSRAEVAGGITHTGHSPPPAPAPAPAPAHHERRPVDEDASGPAVAGGGASQRHGLPAELAHASTLLCKVVVDAAAAGVGVLLWNGDDALWWGTLSSTSLQAMVRAALPSVQSLAMADVLARLQRAASNGVGTSLDRLRVVAPAADSGAELTTVFALRWEVYSGYTIPAIFAVPCAVVRDLSTSAAAADASVRDGGEPYPGVRLVSKAEARHTLLLAPYQAQSLILAEALVVACEEMGDGAVERLLGRLRGRYAQAYADARAVAVAAGRPASDMPSPSSVCASDGGGGGDAPRGCLERMSVWCREQQATAARQLRTSVRLPPSLLPLQPLIKDAQAFGAGRSVHLLGEAAVGDAAAVVDTGVPRQPPAPPSSSSPTDSRHADTAGAPPAPPAPAPSSATASTAAPPNTRLRAVRRLFQ
ncbi:hypothetical protein NESM_000844600 [Novymonas esmeraldas]|uniref:Uncharacterized protein n=1 Tax=Novymonas esmeraldas TaxID=1808958 RepID=A0AAW0F081_9TRYP